VEARGAGHGTPHPAEDVPLEAAALVGCGVPTGFAGTNIRGVVVVD
jgi:Zn-dependent alcohol dehydrogenase